MDFDEPNPLPVVPGQQPAAPPPQSPPRMRRYAAQNPREQIYLSFHNTTSRCVNLYYDFNGRRSFFAMLRPGANIKAITFVTHGWFFRDSLTGEFMHVLKRKVYWPKIYKKPDPTNDGQWIMGLRKVHIHLPVDLLSKRCLWNVAQRLRGGRIVLHELPIPITLIRELRRILNRIQRFERSDRLGTMDYGRLRILIPIENLFDY